MVAERLQKIIARAGVTSRRAAEELILAGRVRVNGRVVRELGTKADGDQDRIEVDGRRLVAEPFVYLILHKPRGVVSTLDDPEGRPTVRDLVRGVRSRVYPIGRLDFNTSGVLLLTNDGAFYDGLLHPKRKVPKTYIVKLAGEMSDEDIQRWRDGVDLADGRTAPAEVALLRYERGKTWLEVTLFEGRNQQIRRMGEATGFPVMRLARAGFAGVTAEGLRPGSWRELSADELIELREKYGVPRKIARPSPRAERGGGPGRPRAPKRRMLRRTSGP